MGIYILRNNYTRENWLNFIKGNRKACYKRCMRCKIKWKKSTSTHVHMLIDDEVKTLPCGATEEIICDDCVKKIESK